MKFVPFKAFKLSKYSQREIGDAITITGLRKDKKFTYDQDGKKKFISEYDLKDFYVIPNNFEEVKAEYNRLTDEADKIKKEIDIKKHLVLQKLDCTPLSSMKDEWVQKLGLDEAGR